MNIVNYKANHENLNWEFPEKNYYIGYLLKTDKNIAILRPSSSDQYIVFSDNLHKIINEDIRERKLKNMAEAVRIMPLLKTFQITPDTIANKQLKKLWNSQSYLSKIDSLPSELQNYLKCVPILENNFMQLLKKDYFEDLLTLSSRFSLSFSNFRIFSEYVQLLEQNKVMTFNELIKSQEFSNLENNERSDIEKWNTVKQYMKKIIYPAFCSYQEKAISSRTFIEKKGKVKLLWDEYFENPEFKITFSFSTFNEFKKILSILSNLEIEKSIDSLFSEPSELKSDD